MVPRAGLDECGKSRHPTGIRSPDRPARSESLYRLSYPVSQEMEVSGQIQDPGRLKVPVDTKREAGGHQVVVDVSEKREFC